MYVIRHKRHFSAANGKQEADFIMNIVQCRKCEFLYAADLPSDRRQHRRRHDEFVNGVRWRGSDKEAVVYFREGFRVVRISPASPTFLRARAAKVGRQGNRETHYDFGVYDDSETDAEALVGVIEDRAISILVMRPMDDLRRWSWSEYDGKIDPRKVVGETWGCSFLWVLPKHRRVGIGKMLVDSAVERSGVSREPFPFTPPFTEAAEAFVRRYCPNRFSIGWSS